MAVAARRWPPMSNLQRRMTADPSPTFDESLSPRLAWRRTLSVRGRGTCYAEAIGTIPPPDYAYGYAPRILRRVCHRLRRRWTSVLLRQWFGSLGAADLALVCGLGWAGGSEQEHREHRAKPAHPYTASMHATEAGTWPRTPISPVYCPRMRCRTPFVINVANRGAFSFA